MKESVAIIWIVVFGGVVVFTAMAIGISLSGSSELQQDIEYLEYENSRLVDCIKTLQHHIDDVRSDLGQTGTTYNELYETVFEAERNLDPVPIECK
jgi:cell division protein FtsB